MTLEKFTFCRRWSESIAILSDADRLAVYEAIIRYALDMEDTSFKTSEAQMAFSFIKSEINEERRRKNDIAKKRSLAGKLGGRPKGSAGKQEEPPPHAEPQEPEVEYVEVIEEIPAEPSPASSTATTLFGDSIPLEEVKPQRKKPPKDQQKHHYAPDVLLTDTEYSSLVSKFGEDGANWMIEKLDGYKAARGMTYKSDYRAILNWVVKEYQREINYGRTTTNRQFNQPTAKEQRDAEFASYLATKLGGSDAQK